MSTRTVDEEQKRINSVIGQVKKTLIEKGADEAGIPKMVKVPDGCSGRMKWVPEEPEEPKRFCTILRFERGKPVECGGEIQKQSTFHRTGPIMVGGRTDGYYTHQGVCEKCRVITEW